jgi:predicted lipid-binding transport protein (Tim44 family)
MTMNVSKWVAGVLIGVVAAAFTLDAEAQRRMGSGKNLGKQSPQVQQRQATPPAGQTPPQTAPSAQPSPAAAAPAAATGAAAGAAKAASSPMRNMLIGAAAGLGLMALASWLGFGETMATIMLFVLIGLVAMMVIGYFLRRSAAGRAPQPAYQGAGGYGSPAPQPMAEPARQQPMQRSALEPAATGAARPGSAMDEFLRGGAVTPAQPWGVPAGFDTESFLGHARGYYDRLQAAWDSGNLEQLQEFTSNEMFIALTHELRARGSATRTEVVKMETALLGVETLGTDHVASVRFTGVVKVDGEVEQVDEVWNLAKPVNGSHGWLLAGIQQLS